MTTQRRRFDSAADATELAEIDRRAQKLDRLREKITDARRELSNRRRRVTDRMRKRGEVAA
jgi:predicted transcriptional regulator